MNLMAETALHNGKYVLDTQLGKGIFEITYQATNTESGQTVVIKSLGETLRHHSDFDQFKQEFLDFGDRLSRCEHPNLVRVLDCFEEAGLPYWVMEYIPGQTLAELIQADVLPEGKAIAYIRQIANGLSVVHKVGLLHQDIKPENIIRRQDTDGVVLCELGITGEFTPGVMQTRANLLSAGYAPLEQHTFEEQRTPATDIYALAATLYCLLTGQPPLPAPVRETLHSDGNVGDGLAQVEIQEHYLFSPALQPSLHKLNPGVKQMLGQGLELSRQKRPQTVEAWLSLLPNWEIVLTPQRPVAKRSLTQSRKDIEAPPLRKSAQADIKLIPKKSQTPQLPIPPKNPTPQPAPAQNLATNLNTLGGATMTSQTKLKTSNSNAREAKRFRLLEAFLKFRNSPLRALLMTGAIAASAGVGFGFALRINTPNQPGSTLLHTEQSFPPTSNWPMSEPQL